MMSSDFHCNLENTIAVRTYHLHNEVWVFKVEANEQAIALYCTREQLRELYNSIGNEIGFSLPSSLISGVEITQEA